MINLQCNLRVPNSDRFRNYRCWYGILPASQHKFWELQIYKSADILDLFLRITTRQSHAGIETGVGILGINIEFRIYDHRHWDDEENCWIPNGN